VGDFRNLGSRMVVNAVAACVLPYASDLKKQAIQYYYWNISII